MAARTPSNSSSPATPRLLRTRDESLNICGNENDDEAEKRERQKIRALELQKSAQSPLSDRRLSISNVISGLSNAQLAEHYTNCIKLSSENKITMKNAFNLHLIDYMQSMMKKKNSEMDNFQVASCTLDASAKIYASRVDYVHAETFKIAGGFCRNGEKQSKKNKTHGEDGDDDDGGGGDGDENGPTSVKRRKIKRKNTVEHNLKNINLNKIDEEYTFDPLYQKMRLTFDEGGTSSLLLNSLSSKDDGSELQFDSKEPAFPPPPLAPKPKPTINIDLSSIKDILLKISKDDKQICPEFADFTFINWNPDAITENADCAKIDPISTNLAFDDAGGDYFDGDDGGSHPEDDDQNGGDDAGDFFQDADHAEENEGVGDEITKNKDGRKSLDLLSALAMEPSEYSYFNTDFLKTWAGAEHWHPSARFQGPKKPAQPQTRKLKEPFSVKFTDNEDFEGDFKTKKSNQLTKKTLTELWSKKKTTLPHDLHYNAEELHKLFLKPKLKISKKKSSRQVDDVIEQYDYDNPNDCENFCPPQPDDNHDVSRDLFSFDDTVVDNNTVIGFTADNLVQQPYKVEKISVQYARTAKKIDVQKLKSSMWKLLKTAVAVEDEPKDEMNFTLLYDKLPTEVTGKTLENLSVPIAFVCLLYLANEKELEISSLENLSDLIIKH